MQEFLNRWYVAAALGLAISSVGLVLPPAVTKFFGGAALVGAAVCGGLAYLRNVARKADTTREEEGETTS